MKDWRGLLARAWPDSGAMSPIPALDGLRAVAILLVLVFHAAFRVPGYRTDSLFSIGYTGIHLFFVLSGFLLFLPYARWLYGIQKRPSTRLFYMRRLLRVGPAYWASLAIILLLGPHTFSRLVDVGAHATFFQNLYGPSVFSLDGVFYTLAIEFQFYLCLPLIAVICVALARRVPALVAALGVAVALVVISELDHMLSATSLAGIPAVGTALVTDSSLPYWLGTFASGIAASVLFVGMTNVWKLSPAGLVRLGGGAAIFGLLLWISLRVHFMAILPLPLYGVAYAAILLSVVTGPAWLRAVFESKPLRFVGLVSYSLYIWHLGVLKILDRGPLLHLSFGLQVTARLAILLTVALGVAYVSYQLTERPFMRARRQAQDQPQRADGREPAVATGSLPALG